MTHDQQIQTAKNTPAQTACKASIEDQKPTEYRIEASIKNPETITGEDPHDHFVVSSRAKANFHAKNFWTQGYWVAVYDNNTGELLAGSIDPDAALPSYIV